LFSKSIQIVSDTDDLISVLITFHPKLDFVFSKYGLIFEFEWIIPIPSK